MSATDLLKTLLLLMVLLIGLFLGAVFIAWAMGLFYVPFGEWVMSDLFWLSIYLYMFITLLLILFLGIAVAIQRYFKKQQAEKQKRYFEG